MQVSRLQVSAYIQATIRYVLHQEPLSKLFLLPELIVYDNYIIQTYRIVACVVYVKIIEIESICEK
jgi:hypothetical protein